MPAQTFSGSEHQAGEHAAPTRSTEPRLFRGGPPTGGTQGNTDFMMRSACEKAEQSLSDQTQFVLGEKQWKAFMAALDRPPKDKPRLTPLVHRIPRRQAAMMNLSTHRITRAPTTLRRAPCVSASR